MNRNEAILITGGARRIGRVITLYLANLGHAMAIHHKSSNEDAQDLVDEIKSAGGTAIALGANLEHEDQTATLIDRASEALGRPITCLINNASQFEPDDITNATRATWDLHMEVNLRAPFILSQSFTNALPKESSGNIINIIDQRVKRLDPTFSSYTVSKVGLWTLTQTMAQALAPNIRVNGIGPGPVLASTHQSEKDFEREVKKTLLGQATDPQEIAQAIQFILDTPSLTGQMIALDGGQHLA
jgi:NAD(P)-dependent dehydrogenase (short-subunit alcohol dehydrogenase family)